MDLRDIIIGFAYLVFANLTFFLMNPIFGGLMTTISTAISGSYGASTTIVAVGWGVFIFSWGLLGVAIPIYMIVKGANSSQ